MNDRPLFGAGSSASKSSKNRTAFLRPAPISDGRLNADSLNSQPRPEVAPATGTKADRQVRTDLNLSPEPVTAPISAPAPVATPVAAPVQNVVMNAASAPNPVAEHPLATTVQTAGAVPTPEPTASDQALAREGFPEIEPEGSVEDRQLERKRALKGALIVRPGQMMSSYACKIRNESRGGVMLVLPDALLVPPEFYLVRDADPGHKVPCRVAWRERNRLGAEFIAALSNP